MTKYRILKNGNQRYKVQYKNFLFWFNLREYCAYDGGALAVFNSINEAREAVIQHMEESKKIKNQNKWTVVEYNNYDV